MLSHEDSIDQLKPFAMLPQTDSVVDQLAPAPLCIPVPLHAKLAISDPSPQISTPFYLSAAEYPSQLYNVEILHLLD